MHTVYAGRENNDTVCVVVDDIDIYLILINISHHIRSHLYFQQGKTKDKDGVNYHDTHAIAVHLGEEIYQILPRFPTLTGSDFTNPFFGGSKIKAFQKSVGNNKIPQTFIKFAVLPAKYRRGKTFCFTHCI